MNVLFVYTLADTPLPPVRPLNSWTKIQMGISYISSVMKEAGHKTMLIVPRRRSFENDVDGVIHVQG